MTEDIEERELKNKKRSSLKNIKKWNVIEQTNQLCNIIEQK